MIKKTNIRSKRLLARTFIGILNGQFLKKENVVPKLPYMFFIALLIMVYIGNTHHNEKTVRKAHELNKELKELRSEYITARFDLMFKSRLSEVAKNVEMLGLKEPVAPPRKISIESD
jgi:hypothetical protein